MEKITSISTISRNRTFVLLLLGKMTLWPSCGMLCCISCVPLEYNQDNESWVSQEIGSVFIVSFLLLRVLILLLFLLLLALFPFLLPSLSTQCIFLPFLLLSLLFPMFTCCYHYHYCYCYYQQYTDAEGHVCGHRVVPALGAIFSAIQSGRIQGAAK